MKEELSEIKLLALLTNTDLPYGFHEFLAHFAETCITFLRNEVMIRAAKFFPCNFLTVSLSSRVT
jgi:hypothetical protein